MNKKIAVLAFVALMAVAISLLFFAIQAYKGEEPVRIYVPSDASSADLRDSLISKVGPDYGRHVYWIWKTIGGDIDRSKGSYVINPGQKAYSAANRIAKGHQTPVKITVNVARTLDDLSAAIASRIEASPADIVNAMDSVLSVNPEFGTKPRFTAAILPDTYEVYWNDSPQHIVETLVKWRDKFWTDERRKKAKEIGLTPVEVTTLASIVEEESNKSDEQPLIARLYLNRLDKGMKLQADPTVKFALGDFSLRRINASHLQVDSPYNTYKINGLPPGPIRVPQKASIDAVLNPAHHNYIYMCAKEDFSGYHNFATDYSAHLANARRYTAALNRLNIH